jgi:hypothetical protein
MDSRGRPLTAGSLRGPTYPLSGLEARWTAAAAGVGARARGDSGTATTGWIGTSGTRPSLRAVVRPLEEWTVQELRAELGRIGDELARRAEAPAPGRRAKVDVVQVCERWVRGHAWDETFTREMVEDELAVRERRSGQALPAGERERLVALWLGLRDERARAA